MVVSSCFFRVLFILLSLLGMEMSALASGLSLKAFDERARNREPLDVVFLGGSLTWGANASDPQTTSYRGRMMQWLRERYPNTPITFHDAAIGGTGSQLGLFRLDRDVLSRKPDLVFLDFSVNDNAEGEDVPTLASYERLVRDLISQDVMVFPVMMTFQWQVAKPDEPLPPRLRDHSKIAEAYGLPVADVMSALRGKVKEGAKPEDFWTIPKDGAHPGDEGYLAFFEAVRDRYERALGEDRVAHIPEKTVFADLYPRRTRAVLVDSVLPEGWSRQKTYRTSLWFDGLSSRWMGDVAVASAKNRSAALEVEFDGSLVGISGEANGLTPPVRIWIDDVPVQHPKAKEGDFLWPLSTAAFAPPKNGTGNLLLWKLISNRLSDGKHRLKIEPVWDNADKEAELRIESICSAGR
jgi:lysophospholipase L1-like esterase